MKFKRKKPIYRSVPLKWEPGDCPAFTMLMNAAIETALRDTGLTPTQRLELFVTRSSWGNWHSVAVEVEGQRPIELPEELRQTAITTLRGPGPCPVCEAADDPNPDRMLGRWHKACLVFAYAKDAQSFGSEDQRKWAAEVIVAWPHYRPPLVAW